ncbi:MAG: hemolysin family protein [Elusimicrobiota bacterium]
MMSTILWAVIIRLIILIFLLLLTMFFTASETSLTVLRRSQIKRLISEEKVKSLQSWLDDPNRLLTTTLVGTAICVVGVSVMGTSIGLDLSRKYDISATLTTTISTFVVLILVLVFAEIVPKAYARRNARKVSCHIIKPLKVFDFILTPVVKIFTALANVVIKLLGGQSLKQQPLFAFEEIKGLIEMGVSEGVIAGAEKKMLSQIMEFGDTIVREVMVPKVDVKSLDISMEQNKFIETAINMAHSRIPVYEDNVDNIIGVIYVKDLLPKLAKNEQINIRKLLRKPYFVPETKQIGSLLKEFRKGREHIAVVVDEYGVPTGLISIEDIVEEITGEIFDEYDIRKKRITKIDENVWDINAVEDLDKINDVLGIDLPEDKYDSLGGLIVGEMGKVPKRDEEFQYKRYEFKILDASPNRVIKVRLFMNK